MNKSTPFIRFFIETAQFTIITAVIYGVFLVITRLNFPLPTVNHHEPVNEYTQRDSILVNSINRQSQGLNSLTGIKLIDQGVDAFTIRMKLIENASQTIDIQYYMWHKDLTGLMLLSALKEAADRGVRVRLLLDDMPIAGLDNILYELNELDNFEIRIFNPFVFRAYKPLNFMFDFFRLNRRMHNKSLIVDQAISLIGGRNIGDEYFDTGEKDHFIDLDVLTIGHVVPDMVDHFKLFYNDSLAIPVELIIHKPDNNKQKTYLSIAWQEFEQSQQHDSYKQAIKSSQFNRDIQAGTFIDEWTKVTLLNDIPDKIRDTNKDDELMLKQLLKRLEAAELNIDVISPYFIPAERMDVFKSKSTNNIDVRILTNSFNATDAMAVHAGYVQFRQELLKSGVELFELKNRNNSSTKNPNLTGSSLSSGTSLHAKTFTIDEKLVFIGSFNFDPRSASLNTEMGVVIESKRLAKQILDYFEASIQPSAFKLSLDENDKISWKDQNKKNKTQIYAHDPKTNFFQRIAFKLFGLLPIKWLL